MKDYKNIEYKGFYIEYNFYGRNEYTVQYCGDDCYFETEEAAREFIDSIEDEAVEAIYSEIANW